MKTREKGTDINEQKNEKKINRIKNTRKWNVTYSQNWYEMAFLIRNMIVDFVIYSGMNFLEKAHFQN